MNLRKDIPWVNHLKCLGIIAVILGHMNSPYSSFIFSWHMPLFFILSGFFLDINYTFKNFIKKDFRRLMIPYFLFGLLAIGVEWLKHKVLHRPPVSIPFELSGLLFKMNYSGLHDHYGFVLWFLPTLFLARLILFLCLKKGPQTYWASGIVSVICFLLSFKFELPFAIDHALNTLIFVWFGKVSFHLYSERLNHSALSCLYLTAGLILYWYGVPELNLALKFYSQIPLNLVWAILMTSIFIFSMNRFENNFSKVIADQTMVLFIFHPYTNNIAHLVGIKLGLESWIFSLTLSLLMLVLILMLKASLPQRGILKYV